MSETFEFTQKTLFINGFLFGFIIVTILIIILFNRRFRNKTNLIFAIILINIDLLYVINYLIFTDRTPENLLRLTKSTVEMFSVPLIYLYLSLFIKPFQAIYRKFLQLILAPFFAGIIFWILFILENYDSISSVILAGNFVSMLLLYYSFVVLKKYKVLDNRKHKKWIRTISYLLIIHAGFIAVEANIYYLNNSLSHLFSSINGIYYVILAYFLIYNLITHPEILRLDEITKYAKKRISGKDENYIISNIHQFMRDEKPFLNPDLNIKMLSDQLNISVHLLSEALNNIEKKNFYDFINQYRVEEFKDLLQNPDYHNYTILGVAYEAGFKSKSTFNSSFRKFTGETPSSYRKKIISSS